MKPSLRDGDAVLVALNDRRIRPGDLAVFRLGPDTVVHRCVAVAPERLRFRGDGREALDPPVALGGILGRVVAVRRAGTWFAAEGGAASAYGRAIALHARFWSASRAFLGGTAGRLDRGLLRGADRLLFRACHRPIPPPPGLPGGGGAG